MSTSIWAHGFAKGMLGAVFAVRNDENSSEFEKTAESCEDQINSQPQKLCEFVTRWMSAQANQRVFVAFTRADKINAVKVKRALEALGYVAFIYLEEESPTPWADPLLAGEAFGQSEHRYVIDSKNSRGSAGVEFEAQMYEFLLSGNPQGRYPEALSVLKSHEDDK